MQIMSKTSVNAKFTVDLTHFRSIVLIELETSPIGTRPSSRPVFGSKRNHCATLLSAE
ncbi:hypothetical protein Ciccas_011251, partial [Cichlidogyrus casuarinus]